SPKLGPSLADRAISAIKAAGRALTLDEIVKELLAQGVDGSSENFRTTVYTGLKRRAQDLRRTENGLWDIRVAVVK
ncbi:MAG: hypothetical protein ABIP75_04045, partial [Pyrinomonadaceae bacterium]